MFTIAREDSFDFLSAQYRALFAASCATAFQHPLWLDRLYRRLAPHLDAEPLVITARWRADGRLALVLPLMRRRLGGMRVIEFADLRVSDYVAPVCDQETFAALVRDAAACAEVRKALQPFDVLRIMKLREDALPLDRLFGTVTRSAMSMSAHSVPLYGPFAQWRADKISHSYGKELDKKCRQIRRKGDVSFGIAQGREAIVATLTNMREYRRPRFAGRADPDLLQRSAYFDFYLDVGINGVDEGLSRTYTLWLDGDPISGVWGMRHRGQFLTVLSGFDHANYKNYSIGAMVFRAIASDCIANGESVLDFTVGDEAYKQMFGTHPTGLSMIFGSGSSLGAVVGFVTEQMPWTMRLAKRIANRAALL